jgi:hypothetical protein
VSDRPAITQQQLTDAIEAVCDELYTHDRDAKHAIGQGLRRVFEVDAAVRSGSAEPEYSLGQLGTCSYAVGRGAEGTAPCGYVIELTEERAPDLIGQWNGPPPIPHFTRVWRHIDRKIDAHHRAQFGGPS